MITDAIIYCLPPRLRDPAFSLSPDEKPVIESIYRRENSATLLSQSDEKRILQALDMGGIDRAVLTAIPWKSPDLCRETNDHLLNLIASEKRFFCTAAIQPSQPGWEREAERCLNSGAMGIVINPTWQEFEINPPSLYELCRFIADKNAFLSLHFDQNPAFTSPAPTRLLEVAERNPETRFLATGHGGLLSLYGSLRSVARKIKNVWFDTSVPALLDLVDYAVSGGVAHRMVFASAYPFNKGLSPKDMLKQVRSLGIAPAFFDDILANNFFTLAGRTLPNE